MEPIHHTCLITGKEFEISQAEQEYCEKRGIPLPIICPVERFREMYSWRNETKLFQRPCSHMGKMMVSSYRPYTPFPVFDRDAWFSDELDPFAFGRAYDFTRSFFDQYKDLIQRSEEHTSELQSQR